MGYTECQLTPGTKVKTLYFWFLIAFLGYFSSHFSGQPSHTVLAFNTFFLWHMWARQSQQLTEKHEKSNDVFIKWFKNTSPDISITLKFKHQSNQLTWPQNRCKCFTNINAILIDYNMLVNFQQNNKYKIINECVTNTDCKYLL